jgi:hypothetical protein
VYKETPIPPNIKTTLSKEECCIKCLHCDDEIATYCMKYKWFEVEWEEVCDSFKGSN